MHGPFKAAKMALWRQRHGAVFKDSLQVERVGRLATRGWVALGDALAAMQAEAQRGVEHVLALVAAAAAAATPQER